MARLPMLRAMLSNRRHFLILAAPAVLFALRVVAQAMQRWHPLQILPPFDAFQGSALPYAVLLLTQVAVLAIMARLAWRVRVGKLQRQAGVGGALAIAGAIYFSAMLIRLLVGFAAPAAPGWFKSWIPGAFHLVLAAFVLALAAYHRQSLAGASDRKAP